jgi:dihydroflavonol-4-reductase
MFVITGVTGHIGNKLLRHFIDQKEDVIGLARQSDASLVGLESFVVIGDVTTLEFLDRYITKDTIFIHAAAYIDIMNNQKLYTYRTNYLWSKRIADLCMKKDARLIYISSVDVLERSKGLISEPNPFVIRKSNHHYKMSKMLSTKYVLDMIENGLNGMVLYPSAVIGIPDYKPSLIGREVLNIMRKKILFSMSGGYNFIDLDDLAYAIYKASKSDLKTDIILSGYNRSIDELYQSIMKVTHHKKTVIKLPKWLVRLFVIFSNKYSIIMLNAILEPHQYDHSKMKKYLIDPLTPFEKTIEKTVNYFKASL